MTPSAPSGPQFSQVLRHQLQDLRIDPDTVSAVHHAPAPNRLKAWFADHKDATLTVALGIGVLVVIFGVVVGVALLLGETSTPARNAPPTAQTSVSSGTVTVPMTGSSYRYMAPGQASLTLHVNLHNPTDAQLQLRAGDLTLMDPHGAAFPPTWHTADGTYADGLANPTHVFMALDPNADTSIDLQFLVLSNGPFRLRYQRQGDAPDSQLPELTLGTTTN